MDNGIFASAVEGESAVYPSYTWDDPQPGLIAA